MKNTVCYLFMFLLLSVLTIAKAAAQEAHVHGMATLALAVEAGVLDIQLESAAANLVGFEHSANSPEEKQTVKQTEALLESPELLFSFTGTSCTINEQTVDTSVLMGIEIESDHHEKDDEHTGISDHNDDHSDITASYRFSCENTGSLKSVSIELFNQFPGIEEINAIWVIETGQGTELLNPDNNTLSLK